MELTLAEAAKTAKRSKQALAVAIQKGKLSASKDANGQWQIDTAELFRVYPPANQTDHQTDQRHGRHLAGLTPNEDAEIRVLRAQLQAAEARLDDLHRERDAWQKQAAQWQEQAAQLLRALPAGLAQNQSPVQAAPAAEAPAAQPEPVQAQPRAPERPVQTSQPDEWIEVPDEPENPKKRGFLARWFGGGQSD